MKKAGILAGLVVLSIAAYLGSRVWAQAPAPAQPVPTRIGVINMVEVIKNYKKAQNMEAELRRAQHDWENKLKPFQEQALLQKNRYTAPTTSPQEKEQIERDMRKLQNEFQGMEEDAKKDLMKRSGVVYQQLYHEVEDAVNRFAGSNGYAIVLFYNDASSPDEKYSAANATRKFSLPAAAIPIYVAPQVDISAYIVQNMNAMYPAAAAGAPAPGPYGANH